MTTTERCKHDMQPEYCYWCGHPEQAHPRRSDRYPDRPVRVVARYHGMCSICELPIEAGAEIGSVYDDEWSHYGCIDWEDGENDG